VSFRKQGLWEREISVSREGSGDGKGRRQALTVEVLAVSKKCKGHEWQVEVDDGGLLTGVMPPLPSILGVSAHSRP